MTFTSLEIRSRLSSEINKIDDGEKIPPSSLLIFYSQVNKRVEIEESSLRLDLKLKTYDSRLTLSSEIMPKVVKIILTSN